MHVSDIDNRFVKMTAEEYEALVPKKGELSPLAALFNLKLLLFSCNRETTKKHYGEVVTLNRWEDIVSLGFLATRFRWRDDRKKVSRWLNRWQKQGFITKRNGQKSNFIILGLATPSAIPHTPSDATPSATPNDSDNQEDIKEDTIPSAIPSATPHIPSDATNRRSKEIERKEEIYNYYNAHARYKESPFELQIKSLLNFLSSDIGQSSLEKACGEYKINFPPSTKCLVEQVEEWASTKHMTKSGVLASFKDDAWKCWADFYRNWMKYLESDWSRKLERTPKRGKKPDDVPKTWKADKYASMRKDKDGLVIL